MSTSPYAWGVSPNGECRHLIMGAAPAKERRGSSSLFRRVFGFWPDRAAREDQNVMNGFLQSGGHHIAFRRFDAVEIPGMVVAQPPEHRHHRNAGGALAPAAHL